jgi:prepilin-type processing-associated H-X9-DG protein
MSTLHNRARGFTLVELLTVVGITALLIGLLLPGLSRSREASRRIACLSNLRQLAIQAHNYANSNRGYYPIAYFGAYSGLTTYNFCWDFTTITHPGRPTQVIPGILWEGKGTQKIQQCPSFEGPANWADNPYTGYNYNTSYIGHGDGEAVPSPAKVSHIRRPSTVALFGDGQYSAGANKFMRAPFPNPGDATFSGRWAGTQGFRHARMTNVAFCDGHAESLRDRFTANKDGAAKVAPGTGFISKDNSLYGG